MVLYFEERDVPCIIFVLHVESYIHTKCIEVLCGFYHKYYILCFENGF